MGLSNKLYKNIDISQLLADIAIVIIYLHHLTINNKNIVYGHS